MIFKNSASKLILQIISEVHVTDTGLEVEAVMWTVMKHDMVTWKYISLRCRFSPLKVCYITSCVPWRLRAVVYFTYNTSSEPNTYQYFFKKLKCCDWHCLGIANWLCVFKFCLILFTLKLSKQLHGIRVRYFTFSTFLQRHGTLFHCLCCCLVLLLSLAAVFPHSWHLRH